MATTQSNHRTCSAEGCTKKLRDGNTSGRCTPHWYVPKGERKAGVAAQAAASTFQRSPAPKKNGNGGAHIGGAPVEIRVSVTPEWLDLAWSRLDPQQKATAIAAVLVS
jgi:hypothetical protein